MKDLEKILVATLHRHVGGGFHRRGVGLDHQGKASQVRPALYRRLVYQPMLEVLSYLRANGYKTYIVTGGGQDFVRVYSERVYGVPPEAGGRHRRRHPEVRLQAGRDAFPDQGAEAPAQ